MYIYKNTLLTLMFTCLLTIINCLLIICSVIVVHHDRDNIVTNYLQTKCELISNNTGSQYWYECNKTNHNPGTKN